jgi:hypothetical protein
MGEKRWQNHEKAENRSAASPMLLLALMILP